MCKTCSKCGVTYDKPEENFYMIKNKYNGTICKYCIIQYRKVYFSKPENKSKKKKYHDKYREKNYHELLEKSKKRYSENPEKNQKKAIDYYNRVIKSRGVSEASKLWVKNNAEVIYNRVKERRKLPEIKLKIKESQKKDRILLKDSYIKHLLRGKRTLNIENPTAELIQEYRKLILLKREKLNFVKQIKQELNIKSL
jgi:hypothetical protein